MTGRQRRRSGPGAVALTEKRALYIRLMNQGESNAAACRTIGINRKTGHHWLHGRTARALGCEVGDRQNS
jgi:IS30 family transposase